MRLSRMDVALEVQQGAGAGGDFYLGDSVLLMPELLSAYKGKVQLIYLDPPFATGQQFQAKVRVGERDYQSGNPSLTLNAYSDNQNRDDYLVMMREVLIGARELLSGTGSIFLHIDHRMSARLRLLMDDVFGEDNFLNEIVWSYQTGGRAKRHFSRKHDMILFYRKGKRYYFDIDAVAVPRDPARRNHMRRHVDTDGRVYRSIRSGGKVYTYYDDEPTYPGDVWDDVSHLQQKDPQRTGYDTQKPLSLLNRIVLCASQPGDLVCDLFAGSGTTLESAHVNGRKFIGADKGLMSMHTIRGRLSGANVTYHAPECQASPIVEAELVPGIAFYSVTITRYELESGLIARSITGLDALDSWSAGYIRNGAYACMSKAARSKAHPALEGTLQLPVFEGSPVIRTQDVLGRYCYYSMQS